MNNYINYINTNIYININNLIYKITTLISITKVIRLSDYYKYIIYIANRKLYI